MHFSHFNSAFTVKAADSQTRSDSCVETLIHHMQKEEFNKIFFTF